LAWRAGEQAAFDELLPLVYDELRRLARRALSAERSGHSLQASALVHEAYMRLLEINRIDWQDRAHFFAFAARVMRRILVDWARARKVSRRGGGAAVIPLDEARVGSTDTSPDLVALDDALNALATIDERKARVVEMRFFGGMSVEETAALLEVSPGTVMRDWRLAKVWLLRELSGSD
jgi:RNA polymerase sigma-70 factor (ECF subfamily)